MPQNERSPGTDVIDVPIAIDIQQIGSRAAFDDNRLPANSTKRPRRAIHASRHQLLRPLKQRVAPRPIHPSIPSSRVQRAAHAPPPPNPSPTPPRRTVPQSPDTSQQPPAAWRPPPVWPPPFAPQPLPAAALPVSQSPRAASPADAAPSELPPQSVHL